MVDGEDKDYVSLIGVDWLVSVANGYVGTEVDHKIWLYLRIIIARIRSMVCRWAVVHHTVFHDRRGVVIIGSEMIMWLANVSIGIWCFVDSAENVDVLIKLDIWDVVCAMSCRCGRLELSCLLNKLVWTVRRYEETLHWLWYPPSLVYWR